MREEEKKYYVSFEHFKFHSDRASIHFIYRCELFIMYCLSMWLYHTTF